MNWSSRILAAALLLALCLAACTKQSEQSTYDKQATFIESFVSARMKEDTTATLHRNDGAYRLTLHDTLSQDRDSLRWGGSVALYYGCYTLTSASINASGLVSTNLEVLAQQSKWNVTDTTRFKLDTLVLDKSLVDGLAKGLEGVQPLDEGFILFTGKYGFGKVDKGTIPARSALVYYYLIESIDNE